MKNRKRFLALWCVIICLADLLFRPVCSYGQESPGELYALSAVLMDGDTGRVLYGKEEAKIRPMASTTKIMTCIVALERGNLEETVAFSQNAVSQPEVHLGAGKGESFALGDLLYSLMLESHNDTAVAIAEAVGGDVETFCGWMNEKAKEIGCQNTCFLTPNGLDAVQTDKEGRKKVHSTTAEDLGRIMAYCVWKSPERETFLKITRTKNYTFSNEKQSRVYHCYNHNAYLDQDVEAVSGKTGFTGEAGYCYVAAVESEGRHFVAAVLGCGWPPHKTYKWKDIRNLFSYGREQFQMQKLGQNSDVVLPEIVVEDGIAENGDLSEKVTVSVKKQSDIDGMEEILLGKHEKIQEEYRLQKQLRAPVKKGQKVGSIIYRIGDHMIEQIPVVTDFEVLKLTYSWCFWKIIDKFF